nr:RNA-directed DNA polymerase, eukaryota [Tanacetum cinerariifolium]
MSKLDRFLISENLMYTYPNINAITLPRYLSDQSLIFLREISHDHGPIPFKVFHYWFDIGGFNNLVEGIWNGYQSKDLNPIRFFLGKLKVLKRKIREWNNSRRSADISLFSKLKLDLESIDEIIDRGDGNDEIVCKRSGIINNLNDLSNIQTMEVTQKTKIRWAIEGNDEIMCKRSGIINNLNDLSNIQTMEVTQKTKIRWAIEGDENSSFFHGMLNKKRRTLNVRGVLVDGSWIDNPIDSSRGSILVNGSPTKEFAFGGGFKQGDPLSSFLFVLIMESLYLSFTRVVNAGLFKGISIDDGSVNLSHLFYADDAVFVGQWSDSNITTLVHVLECFHKISGLRINMCKSKLMGLHVDGELVHRAARQLGCLVLNLPFSYFGSIVGDNMARQQA